MKRCPITYQPISSGSYSGAGLRKLNPALKTLQPLPYNHQEQIREAHKRMVKMSIAGVQPKLSARLSVKNSTFQIVDKNGSFILKPELVDYDEVPQNEDLTMKMAAVSGIEVPLHGLVYGKDSSMIYIIKRFDRTGRSGKIHVEDLAQVGGMSRLTKYNYSMERVADLLEQYCTFPMVEKMKLFRRVLFSWMTGNEDMHLKNFSLIHRDGQIELSPAYDLLNTTIILARPKEELALPLMDKKLNFNRGIFFDYYGRERLGLNEKVMHTIEDELVQAWPQWIDLLSSSFLSESKKEEYLELLEQRKDVLQWE